LTPYWEEPGITIYHGDCREILPQLEAESIITDPIWPNCEHVFPGIDAFALLHSALELAHPAVRRVAVHLGCMSDPRFLLAVPTRWPYLRTCYLEYAAISYLGRILRDADVGYVFGDAPDSKEGARVIPGRMLATRNDHTLNRGWGKHRQKDFDGKLSDLKHPATRHIQHVRWLCKWLGGGSVLDPFAGCGTTALACKSIGVQCTLVELEERYCEIAAKRLSQGVLDLQELAT